jgi:protein gp37
MSMPSRKLGVSLPWSPNIWMGVSIENARVKGRIADLAAVPAHVRFLSCEPLIGPLDNLDLDRIHWVIVGGESGPRARTMQPVWVGSIQRQCMRKGVAFFFKQWGSVRKKSTGRKLHGRTYDEMPRVSA